MLSKFKSKQSSSLDATKGNVTPRSRSSVDLENDQGRSSPPSLDATVTSPQAFFEGLATKIQDDRPKRNEIRSVLHDGIKIIGSWSSDGPVEFGGTIEGDLTANSLSVSQTGLVTGTTRAETVEISGTIQGDIHAQTVILRSTAVVQANIYVKNLTIDAGAKFTGFITMATQVQLL